MVKTRMIDVEPDWKGIGEWIIRDYNMDEGRWAGEVRQMANMSSIVRRAQKRGCKYLDLDNVTCLDGEFKEIDMWAEPEPEWIDEDDE